MAPWLAAPSPEPHGPKVLVQTLSGERCEILSCLGWTAHDLRLEVAAKLRVPAAQQRFFHGCKAMQDGDLDAAALRELHAMGAGADTPLELSLLIRSPAAVAMLEVVRMNPSALRSAPDELRDDKEVVMEAVKHMGAALQYATDQLRGDREVVMQAIESCGAALQYAADELRGDREFVLRAVKTYAPALQYASCELRGDGEIVLQAVKTGFPILQYASDELRDDREVVLQAVKNYTPALLYASDELRVSRGMVWQAVPMLQYAT